MSTYTEIAYPFFRKGQVLKNTDLNDMVDYLDQQNRFTRVLVVGSGIFSGLEIDIDNDVQNRSIKITQGFGLSSDGFIIQLKKDSPGVSYEFTHYRKLVLTEDDFKCTNTNGGNGSPPASIDAYELLEDTSGDADLLPLNSLFTNLNAATTFCLVLWVSREEKDRPFCIDVCDESGADLYYTIKPLLVPTDVLDSGDDNDDGSSNGFTTPPVVARLPQFGYHKANRFNPITGLTQEVSMVSPSIVESFGDFKQHYLTILGTNITDDSAIVKAFQWAHHHMKQLGLEGGDNPFPNLKSTLTRLFEAYDDAAVNDDGTSVNLGLQYFYNYLNDLVGAYEEFVSKACALDTAALPLLCKHARYVGLGGVEINITDKAIYEIESSCRTAFQSSLFYEGNNALMQETEFYFERMNKMASDPNMLDLPQPLANNTQVVVTPGRDPSLPLSKQSFPFYYNNDLKKYWSYHKKPGCFDPKVLGYKDQTVADIFDQDNNPLLFHDDEFVFYRIEGHLGKQADDVYDALNFWVNQFNLPFDFQVVHLVPDGQELFIYKSQRQLNLEQKYIDIRTTVVDYIATEYEINEEEIELAESLEAFNCNDFISWISTREEDLHIDKLLSDCYVTALRTLKLMYDLESDTFKDVLAFNEFALQHPGLQHKGGVPAGGTFVVVNAVVPNNLGQELAAFVEKNKNVGSGEQQVAITKESFKRKSPFLNPVEGDKLSLRQPGSDLLLMQMISENSTQMIVGDFCLPYRCCQNVRSPEPSIFLVPDQYCADDDEKYEIWTYPRGGSISGSVNGNAPDSGTDLLYVTYDDSLRKYFLHPKDVDLGGQLSAEVELAYSLGSLSSKTKVTVYEQPDEPVFTWTEEPEYDSFILIGQKLTFSVSNPKEYESFWLVDGIRIDTGEGLIQDTMEQILLYSNKTRYTVSHVFRNGICETRHDEEIDICNFDATSFTISTPAVFNEEPGSIESLDLTVEPKGGMFRLVKADGDSFEPTIDIQPDDGGGMEVPSEYSILNLKDNPLSYGTYTLYYYLPGCGKEIGDVILKVKSNPSIILKQHHFCCNDEELHAIDLHPVEGILTADHAEGLIQRGGRYYFKPSTVLFDVEVITMTITLTYLAEDGMTTNELLYVHKGPKNIVEIASGEVPVYNADDLCRHEGYRYSFKADNDLANHYEWQVNDVTKAIFTQNEVFDCVLPITQFPHIIKLYARTETTEEGEGLLICEHEITSEIEVICKDDLKKPTLTVEDPKNYQYYVKALPVGGVFYLKYEDELLPGPIPISWIGGSECEEEPAFELDGSNLEVGSYILIYGFPECDAYAEAPFIIDEQEKEEESEPEPLEETEDEEIEKVMKGRKAGRQSVIEQLAGDTSLAGTRSFELTKTFIQLSGTQEELNNSFTTTTNLLINNFNRATVSRKEQYAKLLETITHDYFDRIVATTPETLPVKVKDLLEGIVVKLNSTEFDVSGMMKNWKSQELKKVTKATSIDSIKAIFK